MEEIEELIKKGRIKVIILYSLKKHSFIVGADVSYSRLKFNIYSVIGEYDLFN